MYPMSIIYEMECLIFIFYFLTMVNAILKLQLYSKRRVFR
jgi:hypothetical protein